MALFSKIGKLQKQAIGVYRQNRSISQTIRYLTRYVIRRAPIVAHRIFATERPSARSRSGGGNDLRIAILLLGGVGDHVVAARFVRDLLAASGPFKFDTFSATRDVAKWIFKSFENASGGFYDTQFDGAKKNYDAALIISNFIDISHYDLVNVQDEITKASFDKMFDQIVKFNETIPLFQKNRLIMRTFVDNRLQFMGFRRSNALHGIAGLQYSGDLFPLELDNTLWGEVSGLKGPYITVHNGFEFHNITSSLRATKCYPHFDRVVSILKHRFNKLSVVQIGTKTSIPIPNVDLNLVSKTTLPQASAIIKDAICHLDNESGMVHIASCFSTPCCVVFGPTPPDYFGYDGNINIRPQRCGGCWWIMRGA